jgi:hypothetical protein
MLPTSGTIRATLAAVLLVPWLAGCVATADAYSERFYAGPVAQAPDRCREVVRRRVSLSGETVTRRITVCRDRSEPYAEEVPEEDDPG